MKRTALIGLLSIVVFFAAQEAFASTVIYYDSTPNGQGIILANQMYNLVAHFEAEIVERGVAGYHSGDLCDFDYAIYVSGSPNVIPPAFLDDVIAGHTPLLWITGNIEQLMLRLNGSDPFGFQVGDWYLGAGYDRIDYKNRRFERKSDTSYYDVEITGDATVYSTISPKNNPGLTRPHFVCGGNLCYIVENPLYFQMTDDRYWVFADLLHEFFGTDAPVNHSALVRFEDLAPKANDPLKLRALTDELVVRGVPFSFGVVPVYKDPTGIYFPPGSEFHLADDPPFVAVIEYMLAHGGTMIMHGVTHQHDDGISIADWEFVTGFDNEPLPYDSAEWARDRVEWGLAEFAAQGWRPLIWETPHYAASHGDYLVFAEYFDVYYDQPLVFALPNDAAPVFADRVFASSQILPYASLDSAAGMALLPETLGYIQPGVPGYRPGDMVDKSATLTVVRDGVASFFFHHTMVDCADVLQVVDGLIDEGYTFVSPAEMLLDDDPDDDDSVDDDTDDDDVIDDDANDDDSVKEGDDDDNDDTSPTDADAGSDDDDDNDSGCGL